MSSISQQPPADSNAVGDAQGDPLMTPTGDTTSTPEATSSPAQAETAQEPVSATAETPNAETSSGEASGGDAAQPAVSREPAADNAQASATPAVDSSPAATAQQLKQRFPALFSGQPKPLKLRIQVDIQERAPGVFTKQALTAFFRRYTGSHGYLMAASRATHRYDLDGAQAGELSEEHRKIAVEELARRRGNTEARRALEEEQRHNRATLLHDFERTTLTPANFCALKGITLEELDEYLGVARQEAAERAAQAPAFDPRDRGGPPRDHPRDHPRAGRGDRDRRGPPPGAARQGPGPRQNDGPANAAGTGPGRRRR